MNLTLNIILILLVGYISASAPHWYLYLMIGLAIIVGLVDHIGGNE